MQGLKVPLTIADKKLTRVDVKSAKVTGIWNRIISIIIIRYSLLSRALFRIVFKSVSCETVGFSSPPSPPPSALLIFLSVLCTIITHDTCPYLNVLWVQVSPHSRVSLFKIFLGKFCFKIANSEVAKFKNDLFCSKYVLVFSKKNLNSYQSCSQHFHLLQF